MSMSSIFQDLRTHGELLWILVQRNLKIRYKNSVLGFFWTLLGPVFLILIYWVFIRLLKIEITVNALVSGIIVWQFVATTLGDSLNAILGNANLVTKTAFPRFLLPLSTVCANFINYLLTLVVLLVFLVTLKANFGMLYLLPLILITQFALCLGLSLLVSSLNVFFRDVEHLMGVVLLAWFFLSPVMYRNDYVVARLEGMPQLTESAGRFFHGCFLANPMAGIVTAFRNVLLQEPEDFIPGVFFLVPLILSWAILCLGFFVFGKLEKQFGDEL